MSPTTLPTYDQALAMILSHAPPLGEEEVAPEAALGRVLRREVAADRDQPPFDRSAMDGFAVRSGSVRDPRHAWPIAGVVSAGGEPDAFQRPVPDGAVMRIATGAPLPRGADAVIPIEQAEVAGSPGAQTVRFPSGGATPWQNVHRRAEDAAAGQVVLRPGTRLGPQHLGIAAAMGAARLIVAQTPRLALLTTGDELRPPETPTAGLAPNQIRNSNGPLLAALLRCLGTPAIEHHHLPDEPEETLAAARDALSRSHVVVTVGGVSVGERDFLPQAWRNLGLETILHGINIQPGKPVLAARDDCKLVLGLPGNPVSVLATAHLLLWPVLLRMLRGGSGAVSIEQAQAMLPWRPAVLGQAVKSSSRREVFRAATLDADGGATVIAWHGSGDLVHTAPADALVRLPLIEGQVPTGSVVPALPLIGCGIG